MLFLILIFILVPITEIYLFIQIGGAVGALSTVALIILTAIIGAYLVKLQGVGLFFNAQAKLEENKIPADEIFSGICILIAGLLLITPGFFTDTIGFLLLWPAFRRALRNSILDGLLGSFTYGFVDIDILRNTRDNMQKPPSGKDNVLDAEFDIVEDNKDKK